jgi:FkbM family methyltransferase
VYFGHNVHADLDEVFSAAALGGSTCADVGAHIGINTLRLSRAVGASGRVFTFEPDERNFRLLQRNIESNHASNVTAIQAAVGSRIGKCTLQRHPFNFGDHRVKPGDADIGDTTMLTLGDALSDLAPGALSLVKIDVQGFEHEVLRGMHEVIAKNPSLLLVLEICPDLLRLAGTTSALLLQDLAAQGFSGFEIHEHETRPLQLPDHYEQALAGGDVDIVVSRDRQRLEQVIEALKKSRG